MEKENSPKRGKKKKKKPITSSKACSEFEFNSILEMEGIDEEMLQNSK